MINACIFLGWKASAQFLLPIPNSLIDSVDSLVRAAKSFACSYGGVVAVGGVVPFIIGSRNVLAKCLTTSSSKSMSGFEEASFGAEDRQARLKVWMAPTYEFVLERFVSALSSC